MAKVTNEQIEQAMDMVMRMQLVASIDESIKTMTEFYEKLDFKTIDIETLKDLSDAFEGVCKAMGKEDK